MALHDIDRSLERGGECPVDRKQRERDLAHGVTELLLPFFLAGIGLPMLFMASPQWSEKQVFWFILISAVIYAPMMSCYNMPYYSLGAELTPDYHERTNLMSFRIAALCDPNMYPGKPLPEGWGKSSFNMCSNELCSISVKASSANCAS